MEKWRGTWMAHGGSGRFLSEIFQPDDHPMRDMFLNLMALVGFIFFALTLLHLFYGVESGYSFHAYVAIFLILECTVISVKLYIYLRKRRRNLPPARDIENIVRKAMVKASEARCEPPPYFAFSTYDELGGKTFHQKRHSL